MVFFWFYFYFKSLSGSQGSVFHLLRSLPGGSFTETLKGTVECLAGPGLDQPVISRYCPVPAVEQVMGLLPLSHALEEMCVYMCGTAAFSC